ncbi:MAG: hypothetical protein ISR90_04690 [Candidatus Marinimicrobia bacterium]|nr:hypothetical protein [Candidatus Neomarinimicrobiota bacterium]MBL7023336.1 hypothetical protein [Candidatus Neomarinimicrobiota bacterium]MBL7109295.1 hypothetical protein [Candidatus Neomarinimicrobiota bacterium]
MISICLKTVEAVSTIFVYLTHNVSRGLLQLLVDLNHFNGVRCKLLFGMIFLSLVFSQGLTVDKPKINLINAEIKSIQNKQVLEELYIFPVREKVASKQCLNLFSKFTKKVIVEPVMAIRGSSAGFEMDSIYTPSSVFWITPGIKVSGNIPLINPLSNVWIYAWGRFNKHSAYGFNGGHPESGQDIFQYSPTPNAEYLVHTKEPDNGIDFDEGQGGITLMSPSFNVTFGKFNSSLGPFYRGNLSVSRETPSSQQFRINWEIGSKILFTYLVGYLQSGIPDTSLEKFYESGGEVNRTPSVSRYVVNHRLDFSLTQNFRIGLYEQIIVGARNMPLTYLNPLTPYWSAQHELGDLDNVQMGFDCDWIVANSRIYGAFYMDEWSPYATFDKGNNHNWFAWQLGISQLLLNNLLLKTEFTKMTPQVYAHKFDINLPEHHSEPIGFWSDGNSDDLWIGLFYLNDNYSAEISYEKTRFGNKEYGVDILFLSGDFKQREVYSIKFNKQLPVNFNTYVSMRYFDTSKLYKENKFIDVQFALLYNIPF